MGLLFSGDPLHLIKEGILGTFLPRNINCLFSWLWQNTQQNPLKGVGYLGLWVNEIQSIMAEKAWCQNDGLTGHIASAVKEGKR